MTFTEHEILFNENNTPHKNGNNEFFSLVEKYFSKKKLSFSLLEMVLLKERGIGEIYIFARKNFNVKVFYQEYCKLVEKFKTEFKGGVSTFEEWYIQNTWIYTGKGEKNSTLYNLKNYLWTDNFDPRKRKDYGWKQQGLNKQYILDYFNKYAEEISKLELKKHPHYFIIIQPIGDISNKKIFPLGNLYLHFGTLEKVEITDIKKFLLEFLIVWFKCYGGIKYKYLIDRLILKILSNDKVTYYLPGNLRVNNDDMRNIFTYYFYNDENLLKFQKRIDEFMNALESINQKPDDDYTKEIREYKNRPTNFKNLLMDFDEIHFENFLLTRVLALFLFFVKDFSIDKTHKILSNYSTNSEPDSKFLYIYSNLHLWFPKVERQSAFRSIAKKALLMEQLDKKENQLIKKFITSLSSFEKHILNRFLSFQKI